MAKAKSRKGGRKKGNRRIVQEGRNWGSNKGSSRGKKANFGFGKPGGYRRCVRKMKKHLGPGAYGWCAMRYKQATGKWPGKKPTKGKSYASALAKSRAKYGGK